jgi:hypothetical protein
MSSRKKTPSKRTPAKSTPSKRTPAKHTPAKQIRTPRSSSAAARRHQFDWSPTNFEDEKKQKLFEQLTSIEQSTKQFSQILQKINQQCTHLLQAQNGKQTIDLY